MKYVKRMHEIYFLIIRGEKYCIKKLNSKYISEIFSKYLRAHFNNNLEILQSKYLMND